MTAFITLFWPLFFTAFHHLLFPPGSWSFAGTDSLIRLFPEAFWVSYAEQLILGIAGAILLLLLGVLAVTHFVRSVAREAERERELEREAEQARAQVSSAAGPLPIEQFIFYADLAAYGPMPDCDEDDEEDTLPW